jgi:S-adenosylmethionine/arginine decarboxylase-like enzyme
MADYWGYHTILDASKSDVELIDSHDNLYNFVKDLVKEIDMVAYGEPQIIKFGSGNKAGYTLVQLIETSNICAHFVPDDLNGGSGMYLDVFSCKPYDPQIVVDVAKKWFKFETFKTAFVERQA